MIRYCVTDRRHGDVLVCAAKAIRDSVDMIQVREKDLPARDLLDLVSNVRDLAAGTNTRILVNDRLDVALAAGIQGVHLPGNGLPPGRVRRFVEVLGVSIHSLDEGLEAERAGADFVVFGPVFDSPGKKAVGLEPLRRISNALKIPVLAIGGITLANTDAVLNAGAAGIAGIRLFRP
jgi:thiamine-phosphate diphosphorylase